MDLRAELKSFIEIELGGIGRWVLVRTFSDVKSQYWNEITKEAVGGLAYEFTDILHETYHTSVSEVGRAGKEGILSLDPGQFSMDTNVFYFFHDVVINENDHIYDLGWEHKEKPTVVYKLSEEDYVNKKVAPKSKYTVTKVIPKYGDHGRIEYKIVYGEKNII